MHLENSSDYLKATWKFEGRTRSIEKLVTLVVSTRQAGRVDEWHDDETVTRHFAGVDEEMGDITAAARFMYAFLLRAESLRHLAIPHLDQVLRVKLQNTIAQSYLVDTLRTFELIGWSKDGRLELERWTAANFVDLTMEMIHVVVLIAADLDWSTFSVLDEGSAAPLPTVRSLSLGDLDAEHVEGLHALFRMCPDLERLSLLRYSCDIANDFGFDYLILPVANQLTRLELESYDPDYFISGDMVYNLVVSTPRVEHLGLGGDAFLDTSFSSLPRRNGLRSISIVDDSEEVGRALTAIATSGRFPKLECVYVNAILLDHPDAYGHGPVRRLWRWTI